MTDATTSLESPIKVKELNVKIGNWIHKLGHIYVEGQVTQIQRRGERKTSFMTLRDTTASASISVTSDSDRIPDDLADGAHVVVYGKPQFWHGRGTLQLRASEVHQLGEGDLIARVNQTRKVLATEGLFEQSRKKPIPLLPNRIGLITGKDSHAEHDVRTVAGDRWPIPFEVMHVRVQGRFTVGEVITSLKILDANPEVDVIIIARGGGSVEDLLPFSDESLVRAVANCVTPVISAIGHEPDSPILDDVADVRAATPTDAAKRVVPNRAKELSDLEGIMVQIDHAVRQAAQKERAVIEADLASCARYPVDLVTRERDNTSRAMASIRQGVLHQFEVEKTGLSHASDQLAAYNPRNVVTRGYAVLRIGGQVMTTARQLQAAIGVGGVTLEVELSDGTALVDIDEGGVKIL